MNQEKCIALLRKQGCEIDITVSACTIKRGVFYVVKPTFEEAFIAYIEALHERERHLQQWRDDWAPIINSWSDHHQIG